MDARALATLTISVYQDLNATNIESLRSVYSDDVLFEDPAHRIEGLGEFINYFNQLYKNVEECSFHFNDVIVDQQRIVLTWSFDLRHPRLGGGKEITVPGASLLQVNEKKIVHHRDYFDLGAMIYEHVPLLGRVVLRIKRGLGQ